MCWSLKSMSNSQLRHVRYVRYKTLHRRRHLVYFNFNFNFNFKNFVVALVLAALAVGFVPSNLYLQVE